MSKKPQSCCKPISPWWLAAFALACFTLAYFVPRLVELVQGVGK